MLTVEGSPLKVTIYGAPQCGVCSVVKRYLNDQGVRFREIDVSRDPEGMQAMVDLTGGARTVPIIQVGQEAVIGFDKERLDRLLADA
jgi:glutaredoxin 3